MKGDNKSNVPNENQGTGKEQSHHSHSASNHLNKMSNLNSRVFQHNPKNVKQYFKLGKEIDQNFQAAQNLTRAEQRPFTGAIGELASEQSVYARRGNARVQKFESKLPGNTSIDSVLQKGVEELTIESKGSVIAHKKFSLTKTKTQGTQMSSQWMHIKEHEMTAFSPETAKTAKLLSKNTYTKHISGVDVNYTKQEFTFVTDTHRYKNLPHDVTVLETAKSATKAEMKVMRNLNRVGTAFSLASYMLDVAQIIGQASLDYEKGDFGATKRIALEKGGGQLGAIGATAGVELLTGGAGFVAAFVAGGEGFKLGEKIGTNISDLQNYPKVSEEEREASIRRGMDIIGNDTGLAILDGIDRASAVVAEGVSRGCELMNETLPFKVCTPDAPSTPSNEDDKATQSHSEALISIAETPHENISAETQSIHARRLAIMHSRVKESVSESTQFEATVSQHEKPLGFHARRQAIIEAHRSQGHSGTVTQQASHEESVVQSPRPSR